MRKYLTPFQKYMPIAYLSGFIVGGLMGMLVFSNATIAAGIAVSIPLCQFVVARLIVFR